MLKSIYLMLLPVALGTLLPNDNNYPNPGFRKEIIGTQIYTFHRHAATFDEAQNICKQNGGRIAVITSRAQEPELVRMFKTSGPVINASHGWNRQAFIGIQYRGSGLWQTLDGKPAPYLNWSRNWSGGIQPSNPDRQRCGSLLLQGAMDDVQCSVRLAFFCEKVEEKLIPCNCSF
ncbi:hypothetical protein HF086_010799 [Spodoptera exigua]|uniref:C-type lectin domain-containing protein n=1 Tax=Spodoptera exigua TaxID=7107 RepID=A0A922MIU9_SPOEX|nr:hypothetical protein HF086_010799 [Spodoptera exigua]